jgi:hypothetical protein
MFLPFDTSIPVIRTNYSGIRLGRSDYGPQFAVPWNPVEVVNAATSDVPFF